MFDKSFIDRIVEKFFKKINQLLGKLGSSLLEIINFLRLVIDWALAIENWELFYGPGGIVNFKRLGMPVKTDRKFKMR